METFDSQESNTRTTGANAWGRVAVLTRVTNKIQRLVSKPAASEDSSNVDDNPLEKATKKASATIISLFPKAAVIEKYLVRDCNDYDYTVQLLLVILF